MTTLDLSFLNDGNNLVLTLAQLKAMEAELDAISRKAPEILELGSAFGLTYDQAKKLMGELGLAPAAVRQSVATMRQLKQAGADAVTQYAVLAKQLGLSTEQMKLLAEEIDKIEGNQDVVQNLTEAFAQLFVLDKVNSFKQQVLEVGKVFEKLNAQLKTTLGTQEAANSAFAQLQDFASTTPYQLTEVTEVFVKLKQRGLNPTKEVLTSLGDLASSQGKSFDQLAEAVLDAQQGEFERLKEFGIKASAAGDKVNVSFQGVNRQFLRTPEAISAGIVSLGKLQGVAGGMEEQANTLGGSLSNLQDNQEKLANTFFVEIQPYAVAFVKALNGLVDGFFQLDPALQKTIIVGTTLGGVLVSATAALAAFKAMNLASAVASAAATFAETPRLALQGAMTAATKLAAVAQLELNVVKAASVAVTSGSSAAIAANTAALSANAAAAGATNVALTPMLVAFASISAIAITVAGSLAVVVDAYNNVTAGNKMASDSAASLDKSMAALAAATKKREKEQASAAAEAALASENAAKAKMSLEQLTATNAAKSAQYEKTYQETLDKRTSIVTKILDKVRELINLPNTAFRKTFELVAKLPAPQFLKDFFSNAAKEIGKFRWRTAREAIKNGDIIGFNELVGQSSKLKLGTAELKNKLGGDLTKASKGEIEALQQGYTNLLGTVEKVVPVDAEMATNKELLLAQLKKEKDLVDQSAKAIDEKAKRVLAAGSAEKQLAAELKRNAELVTKQIATSEDAQKVLDITEKQLSNGFISPQQARAQYDQIAKYESASADVQIAAMQQVRAIRDADFDYRKGQYDVEIAAAELAGERQVTSAEDTAIRIAKIRAEQAKLEVERQKAIVDEEQAAGRGNGKTALDAQQALQKATIDSEKAAQAELKAIRDKELKELEDRQERRRKLLELDTAKKELSVAKDSLELIKKNDLDQSEIEAQAAARRDVIRTNEAKAQVANLGREIEETKSAINRGLISRGDGAKKLLGLETEYVKSRTQLAEQEANALVAARQRAIDEINKAVKRQNDKEAAESELLVGATETGIYEAKLEAAKQGSAQLDEFEKAAAVKRSELSVLSAQVAADAANREARAVQEQVDRGLINRKDASTQLTQALAKAAKANALLASAQADAEIAATNRAKEAALDAIADENKARQLQFNKRISQIQGEQSAIGRANDLASAQQRLADAQKESRNVAKDLAVQELDLARQAAEKAGDKAKADQITIQIKTLELQYLQQQAAEIESQFATKQKMLELDLRSKELAAEQLVIEKQQALLEAESAVRQAEIKGESEQDLALAKQKQEAAKQALDIAQQAKANQAEIADLSKQALALEKANEQNRQAGTIRKAQSELGLLANNGSPGAGVQQNSVNPPLLTQEQLGGAKKLAEGTAGAGEAAKTFQTTLTGTLPAIDNFAKSLATTKFTKVDGARADGGSVLAGNTYLVGEQGPELVTFGQSGFVYDNSSTASALAAIKANTASVASLPAGEGDARLAQLLDRLDKRLSEAISKPVKAEPINVPVNVTASNVDSAAETLQLIRAARAAELRTKSKLF